MQYTSENKAEWLKELLRTFFPAHAEKEATSNTAEDSSGTRAA